MSEPTVGPPVTMTGQAEMDVVLFGETEPEIEQ